MVAKHHPKAITTGYWFVTPHGPMLFPAKYPGDKGFVPCVNGAHIYDNNGVCYIVYALMQWFLITQVGIGVEWSLPVRQ